jgi:histidinol-phosphate phosphatase family protein
MLGSGSIIGFFASCLGGANLGLPFVLFDRDGTLIEHVHHLINSAQVLLKPDIVEALSILQNEGFKFGIISNQSVIGRGLISRRGVKEINNIIVKNLSRAGITLTFIKICPHLPDDLCLCRKPETLLGLQAAAEFNIELRNSYFVGDQESDLLFGKALGCKVIQILGNAPRSHFADHFSDTLTDAANWISKDSRGSKIK